MSGRYVPSLDELARCVLGAVAELSDVRPDEVDARHAVMADLQIDSLKAIELLCILEETLDIEIDEQDTAGLVSVWDVVLFLSERLGSASS